MKGEQPSLPLRQPQRTWTWTIPESDDWRALVPSKGGGPASWPDSGRPLLLTPRDHTPVDTAGVAVKKCPARVARGAYKAKSGRRGDAPTIMCANRSASTIAQAGDYGRRHLLAAAANGGYSR